MAKPSLTKSFDASLFDLQRSFSSTDTNTTGSSGKENRANGEIGVRDVRSLSNERLYEQWASTYDTDGNVLQAIDDVQTEESIPELVQMVQGDAASSARPLCILDLGCGTGRITQKLLNVQSWTRPVGIHGWDASEHMLAIARSKCVPARNSSTTSAPHDQSVIFRQVDHLNANALPKEQLGIFDLLVSTLVLEHMFIQDFWQCIFALLKPGGVGLMSNMHPDMGAGSVAGFKEDSGQRLIGQSYLHGVQETAIGARRVGLEVWDIEDVAVEQGMIERGEVGERAKKWIGKKIWYGMKFRKPL